MNNCFINFFIGMVSLQVGVSMLTGMFIMLALLMLMVNFEALLYEYSEESLKISFHYVVVLAIILIVIIWLVAFVGAYNNSMTLIKLALICWTLFIITWMYLTIDVIFNHNTDYCIANKLRCAPTMWFFETNVSKSTNNATTADYDYEEDTSEFFTAENIRTTVVELNHITSKKSTTSSPHTFKTTYNIPEKIKNSSKIITIKSSTFKTTAKTKKKSTIKLIDQTTKPPQRTVNNYTVFKNGNVPSNIKPELFSLKYSQINFDDDDDYVNDLGKKDDVKENTFKYIFTVAFFLPLYLYAWLVLISYYIELKCLKECTC